VSLQVSQLAVYPLKSCKVIPLNSSRVTLSGLEFDRRYMLIDEKGLFLTARDYPALTLIEASITGTTLSLRHPQQSVSISINPDQFDDHYVNTEIWETPVRGQLTSSQFDTWFSELLNLPVKLVYFGDQSERFTSRRPDLPVAFADGYPFLLTTEASLEDLNNSGPQVNEMERFRPNIVITGNKPFAEDTWKRIRIGNVVFENVKPCERCIFTTLDPNTAERSRKGEPLKTLAKFRLIAKEGVTFGVNLVAENEGTIHVGDEVEILEFQQAYPYKDKR